MSTLSADNGVDTMSCTGTVDSTCSGLIRGIHSAKKHLPLLITKHSPKFTESTGMPVMIVFVGKICDGDNFLKNAPVKSNLREREENVTQRVE